jgi:hypothetical protein
MVRSVLLDWRDFGYVLAKNKGAKTMSPPISLADQRDGRGEEHMKWLKQLDIEK